MLSEPEEILSKALKVKTDTDKLILTSNKLYYCLICNSISDYYKFGGICAKCEAKGDLVENA